MRWRGERESTNIEDRRGLSGGKIAVGGGLGTVLITRSGIMYRSYSGSRNASMRCNSA